MGRKDDGPIFRNTGEVLRTTFPSVRLSGDTIDFLHKFDNGKTDGITCWRVSSVERRSGSNIEGVGLFAVDQISVGTVLGIKQGHILSEAEVYKNADVIKGSHQQIGPNEFLAGFLPEEVDRNLIGYNHSCDSNARIVVLKGVPLAFLVANKPIEEGEEISTDYSVSTASNTHEILACKCGSPKCRHVIKPATDWKRKEIQDLGAGDFPWFVQELIDKSKNE